jgi:beta-lactamase regulating signal transducer with metallopeptidase domain
MISPQLQTVAQIAIGRILNSLPEGLLIALFAGVMLRLLPRQNSRTRFAVWFMALLAVASLPMIGSVARGHSLLAVGAIRPVFILPGPWGLLLFLVWALAACVAMLRLAVGLWRLRLLRKSCVAVDGADLNPAIQKAVADFSSSRSVTLATSERVSVPAAIGFFHPVIVLPAWALRELTPNELNVILLHEFAHLRRGDAWTNLLQKFVRAVFLFHPAVWWIESRLSLEREMACDDQVLAETANPRGYAKCLVALLEKSVARRGVAMAQAVVHRAREASLRLAQILDLSRPATKHVCKPALGLVGVFSLVCLMAVPQAPQLVAFERNPRAIQSDDEQLAALRPAGLPAAHVIPAALHISSSSPLETISRQIAAQPIAQDAAPSAGRLPQRVRQDYSDRQRATPQIVMTRWTEETERGLADSATLKSNAVDAPAATLLLIETTERVGPNSWVWSVCVWRVTWANQNQQIPTQGAERAPVPSKT